MILCLVHFKVILEGSCVWRDFFMVENLNSVISSSWLILKSSLNIFLDPSFSLNHCREKLISDFYS